MIAHLFKRVRVAIALLLSTFSLLAAQPEPPPEFAWATAAGGLKNDKTRCVTTDRAGNVFLTGEVTDDVKFGEITLKSAGGMDFFVAKLDREGRFVWAQLGGGGMTDRGYAIAANAAGNCYVTGHYESTDADFSGTKLPNRGGYDLFIAKYSASGKLEWMQTAGGAGYDYGHGIAVDEQGDVVITGAVVGESEFAGKKIPNEKGSHPFCAKYHGDGSLVWVKVATGNAGGSGHGVAVDGAGNIYLAGSSSGSGQFGAQPLVTPRGTSALLAKLSPAGDVLWITQNFGEPSCLFHEITCDREGRVWASGMFKGQATFGQESFSAPGDKNSDAFLCHYDATGKLMWTRIGAGPGIDYGLGVATDGKGNCYLTGEFTDTFKLGGAALQSRGSTDVYVAKFDLEGDLRWLTQAGGERGDNAYTLACDGNGDLVLAGSFGGTALFGKAGVTAAGGNDLYAAKLRGK